MPKYTVFRLKLISFPEFEPQCSPWLPWCSDLTGDDTQLASFFNERCGGSSQLWDFLGATSWHQQQQCLWCTLVWTASEAANIDSLVLSKLRWLPLCWKAYHLWSRSLHRKRNYFLLKAAFPNERPLEWAPIESKNQLRRLQTASKFMPHTPSKDWLEESYSREERTVC